MGWCAKSRLINERKSLRQSKTIFSNRRNQFLESQGYTSYSDKILGTEMCIKFESEEISTTGCSKSDSKEVRVDEAIDCQQGEAKLGCFPLCQNVSKFRSRNKWNVSVRVEIFRSKLSTSKDGPLWPVGPVRPKIAVPFQTLLVFSPTLIC